MGALAPPWNTQLRERGEGRGTLKLEVERVKEEEEKTAVGRLLHRKEKLNQAWVN